MLEKRDRNCRNQWSKSSKNTSRAYNLQSLAYQDENEVTGIAKFIAKWTNKNFSELSFLIMLPEPMHKKHRL